MSLLLLNVCLSCFLSYISVIWKQSRPWFPILITFLQTQTFIFWRLLHPTRIFKHMSNHTRIDYTVNDKINLQFLVTGKMAAIILINLSCCCCCLGHHLCSNALKQCWGWWVLEINLFKIKVCWLNKTVCLQHKCPPLSEWIGGALHQNVTKHVCTMFLVDNIFLVPIKVWFWTWCLIINNQELQLKNDGSSSYSFSYKFCLATKWNPGQWNCCLQAQIKVYGYLLQVSIADVAIKKSCFM